MSTRPSPAARLWHLVREERSEITAIYFFAILSGLIQLSLPLGIQAIIGFVQGGTLSASLVVLLTVLILAVLFTGIIQVNQMKVIEKIQQRIFVKYSYAFADRLPKLDLKKVDGFYLPELVNRFFETVFLQKGFAKLLLELPIAIIQITLGLILLSFYHPFFILFGVLVVLLLWLILKVTGHNGLQTSLAESSYKYSLVGWLEEMARLVKTFKFSNAELHLKKADEKTANYLHARTRHFKVLELQYSALVVFKVLITAVMLIGGVLLLLDQQINIGQFVAAEILILMIITSIEKIITNLDSVYDIITGLEKIGKLVDKPLETQGTYQLDPSSMISVEVNGLSFAYREKPIINNVTFEVKPGEKVCIKGKAGTGKSTLLKLLAGVYSDFQGQLLINKVPLGNYDLQSLRERMGILFQQENVFHGTLWENLTMGRPATDPGTIIALCEQCGLQPFVSSLVSGFDTELDPTGKRLPRSVVQKILLVRAFAHKPSLLIMEEPWQGIEEEHRQRIQELILSTRGATVIVATSDETFAGKCDRVIELNIQKSLV